MRSLRATACLLAAALPGVLAGGALSAQDGTWPPLGLDLLMPAAEIPATAQAVSLGERLFFDTRLSVDGSLSCASCHQPARAFTDGRARAIGVFGRRTSRSAPSILNAGYLTAFFWDGRTTTLEEQVLKPITAPNEMGADLNVVVARLAADAAYRTAFQQVFQEDASVRSVAQALAAFIRSRRSAASRYDRYVDNQADALDPREQQGLALFRGRARCVECHTGPLLADGRFHNTGVSWGRGDVGRQAVTGREEDRGRFKTPSLRNVALTAPYMHDGSLATLDAVIEFYVRGGGANPNLDARIRRLDLSPGERRQLAAYLRTLTSAEFDVNGR